MPTPQETQLTTYNREITISYEELVEFFQDNDIDVEDPEQVFTICLRRTSSGGDNRDQVLCEIRPDQSITAKFTEVVGPEEI
jgi:hypothetical protein